MKKKLSNPYLLGILLLLTISMSFFILPTEVKPPTHMQYLDLSLTENDFYLSEENYAEQMTQVVIPYIDSYKTTGYFSTEDDAKIYYEQYLQENAKAHIVLLHGFTENTQKYKEPIYYFLKQGYSVSTLDHRGHGYSTRLTSDPSKVHITDFNIYINDLHTFITKIVQQDLTQNYLLYAHSMGGAIGTLYMQQYPDTFKAAVLSSPMMAIDTGAYPVKLSRWIAHTALRTGFQESYVFGQGSYEPVLQFEESAATSLTRYTYQTTQAFKDDSLQLGGGSFHWLVNAFNATDRLLDNAPSMTLPLLVFQSANDTFVRPEGHYRFVQAVPNTTLIHVPDAKHELYNTENDLMIPYFNTLFNFFDVQLESNAS